MGQVFINLSAQVDDGDDKAAAENAYADQVAKGIGEMPEIMSASFSSDTTGLINLHNRYANLVAQKPAEHPAETGPAASGVGIGPEGVGTNVGPSGSQSPPPPANQ